MSQEAKAVTPPPSPTSETPAATLTASATSSDQKTDPAPVADPVDPDGVLDRLTEVDPKKQNDKQSSDEKPSEDSEPSKNEKVDEKPTEESKEEVSEVKEEPKEEEFDHTADLTEDEAKSVPERTRKRFEKLLAERKEDRPLADYAASIIGTASKLGIQKKDLDAGINLMVGFLAGDKEADKRLVKVLTEQGVIQPPSPAKVNFDAVRASVNKMLKVDFSISEEAAENLLKTIDSVEKENVPQKKEEAPKEEPKAPQADLSTFHKHLIATAQHNVAKKEAAYQAKHPSDWKVIRQKAYEKIGEWEKKMPVEEMNDVTLWPARLVEAVEAVIAERSKSSSVRPSSNTLRSTQPPPVSRKPEKGTEEYDIGLMTGKFSEDD